MNTLLSKKITIFNFVFTIGIVIYHSKNFNSLFSNQTNILLDLMYSFYDLLGSISLGIFFTFSAYLFYLGIDSSKDLIYKIKKRIITLGIPFIVWNFIYLIYNIIYKGIKSQNIDLTFTKFLLGFSFDTFNGPFWYIFALICLLSLSPLIFKLRKYPKVFLLILCVTLGVCCLFSFFAPKNQAVIIYLLRLSNYLPTYIFGAYLALCHKTDITNGKFETQMISIISIIISICIFIYLIIFDFKIPFLNWLLIKVLPITIWLSVNSNIFKSAKIKFPLTISFFLYAMHSFLIGVFCTILYKIIGYNSIPPHLSVVAHLCMISLLYLVCLFVASVSKKLLPKKLYFALSGGRVK